MQCTMMIFGEFQRFCITYKTNQRNFTKYKRNLVHDFKVTINKEDFENSIGLTVKSHLLIAKKYGQLVLFNQNTYSEISRLDLNLEKTTSREQQIILSAEKSHDSNFIAIFVGKKLIRDEELIEQLYVLRLKPSADEYEVVKKVNMTELELNNVSMKFYFDQANNEELFFVSNSEIFRFNYLTETKVQFFNFDTDLTC